MSEHKAPEKPAEKAPEAKKVDVPAAIESERKKRARKVLAEYRREHPEDDREDDVLMRAPNGILEIADLDAHHDSHRAVRMARLAGKDRTGRDE